MLTDEDLIEQYLRVETRLMHLLNGREQNIDFISNQFEVATTLIKEIDSRGLEIPNVDD